MRQHKKHIWSFMFIGISISVAAGITIMLISVLLFSIITYVLIGSMKFAEFFGLASLFAGGISSGYICGRYRRRRGLVEGILCGLVIYGVITVAGGIIGTAGITGIKKLLLLTLSGAAGGVSGVNSIRPKKLMY